METIIYFFIGVLVGMTLGTLAAFIGIHYANKDTDKHRKNFYKKLGEVYKDRSNV